VDCFGPLSCPKHEVSVCSDCLAFISAVIVIFATCCKTYASFMYNVITQFRMLSAFVQRDFNFLGIFLQADYSINCETEKYKMHLIVAGCGILLYTIGIPVLFYFCIKHKHVSG
jgi:hypothetical protein